MRNWIRWLAVLLMLVAGWSILKATLLRSKPVEVNIALVESGVVEARLSAVMETLEEGIPVLPTWAEHEVVN